MSDNKPFLSPRQELFCQEYIQPGATAASAMIKAGYAPKFAATWSTRLLKVSKVKARVQELRDEITAQTLAETISTEIERKERLTAFQREEITGKSGNPVRYSNIEAIKELNKMDHIYEERPNYNDNRQYNFIVQGEGSKEKLGLLLRGAEPKELDDATEQEEEQG